VVNEKAGDLVCCSIISWWQENMAAEVGGERIRQNSDIQM